MDTHKEITNLTQLLDKIDSLSAQQKSQLKRLRHFIAQNNIKNINTTLDIKELLATLSDSIAGIYWWKDKNGTYRGCNDAMVQAVGLNSKDEIIGKTDYELPWVKYADSLSSADKKVLNEKKILFLEEILCDENGNRKIFTAIKKPLKDFSNNIIGTIGTSFDITKHVNSKHYMEQRLDSIADILAGNHWWKDIEGRYLGCNQTIADTLGVTVEEVIGKTDYELPWSDQADNLVANDHKVLESGQAIKSEEQVASKNGEILTFLVNKVPLRDESGKIIGTIGNSVDITLTKKLEEELLKAKELAELNSNLKTAFIQNIEHDIRTPCSGIYQMATALEAKEKDPQKQEILKHISLASNQLLKVLNGVVDFSRIESGTFHVMAKKFNLKTLMEDLAQLELPSVDIKHLYLSIEYPDSIPHEFIGDEFRIHKILLNLISNAIKFTEKGYIKLSADLIEKKDKDVVIQIIVADTGVGISQRAQAILFEKFTKEHPSNQGLYQGTGLGLRIVKQFTSELDGEIEVESIPQKGSKFILNIPLKIPLVATKKS